MTAPAILNTTYRGTNVQQASLGIFLQIRQGLNELPTVRGEDIVVPGKVGRIAGSRVRDARRIVLEGLCQGASGNEGPDFRANVDTLNALFDPTITGALVVTLETGATRTIQARTLNAVWKSITPYAWMVSIEMESVAPDWT